MYDTDKSNKDGNDDAFGREVVNFSAGPSMLPLAVVKELSRDMLSLPQHPGCSILEISHRSKPFESIIEEASERFARLAGVDIWPQNRFVLPEYEMMEGKQRECRHSVLWMTGGGTTQFDCVVYNMLGINPYKPQRPVARYLVTGTWSSKAYDAAKRLLSIETPVSRVEKVSLDLSAHSGLPLEEENAKVEARIYDAARKLLAPVGYDEDLRYIYYCDNETVHGREIRLLLNEALKKAVHDSDTMDKVPPLVIDFSSNVLSYSYPEGFFDGVAIAFAGAQKNLGPSGITLVLARDDVCSGIYCDDGEPMDSHMGKGPILYDYKLFAESQSLHNTPPTFNIYATGLILKWLEETCFASEFGRIAAFLESNREVLSTKFGMTNVFSKSKSGSRASLLTELIRSTGMGFADGKEEQVTEYFGFVDKGSGNVCVDWCLCCGDGETSLGALCTVERYDAVKAALVYAVLDGAPTRYMQPVARMVRSRMSVVFRVCGEDGLPSMEEEASLIKIASRNHKLEQLAGHRSMGGMRASLYTAMPASGVTRLANLLILWATRS